jgi:hypothetical protein
MQKQPDILVKKKYENEIKKTTLDLTIYPPRI